MPFIQHIIMNKVGMLIAMVALQGGISCTDQRPPCSKFKYSLF